MEGKSVNDYAIEERIARLEKKIDDLSEICEEIRLSTCETKESCQRMDSHILFVNGAYSSLRAPLDFLRNRFSNNTPALPPAST